LEAEIYFYSRIFGFELADAIRPVRIENLKTPTASLFDRLNAARDLVPKAVRDGGAERVQKLIAAVRDAVPKRDR
jgi:hypothetical protein